MILQSPQSILQHRPSASYASQPSLDSWWSFPTYHNSSDPPPFLTAFRPVSSISSYNLGAHRYCRSIHVGYFDLLYKWNRLFPLSLLLSFSETLLDPHLPRRPCAPASTKVLTILQMGRVSSDPRIRASAGNNTHIHRW